MSEQEEAQGDCFEVAATIIALYDKAWAVSGNAREAIKTLNALSLKQNELLLVHGWVTRPTDGRVHSHGWIEIPDMRLVLDYANGLTILMPKPTYYTLGEITDTTTYNYSQATKRLLETEIYGPWSEMFTTEGENHD